MPPCVGIDAEGIDNESGAQVHAWRVSVEADIAHSVQGIADFGEPVIHKVAMIRAGTVEASGGRRVSGSPLAVMTRVPPVAARTWDDQTRCIRKNAN